MVGSVEVGGCCSGLGADRSYVVARCMGATTSRECDALTSHPECAHAVCRYDRESRGDGDGDMPCTLCKYKYRRPSVTSQVGKRFPKNPENKQHGKMHTTQTNPELRTRPRTEKQKLKKQNQEAYPLTQQTPNGTNKRKSINNWLKVNLGHQRALRTLGAQSDPN